jgi:hypothetical protein
MTGDEGRGDDRFGVEFSVVHRFVLRCRFAFSGYVRRASMYFTFYAESGACGSFAAVAASG